MLGLLAQDRSPAGGTLARGAAGHHGPGPRWT